ncbi:hypothetical protein [Seinonella peptonophila]|uniref:hypothetical protein n=1 Tax=Seinonella peptonophila TaxID=112248 RepID=UPI0009322A3F|nr:hypothetical protein [Seinonella peptonophila]
MKWSVNQGERHYCYQKRRVGFNEKGDVSLFIKPICKKVVMLTVTLFSNRAILRNKSDQTGKFVKKCT